jgi:hypothetical protein
MNNYLKYIIGISLIITIPLAQVTEKTFEFNFGERNAFYLLLKDTDKSLVEDEWKSTVEKFGKVNKKKGEFINNDILLEDLSNTVDWYMKLEKQKGDIELYLCVISNNEFMSSHNQPDNFMIISKFLSEFAYTVDVAKVRAEYNKENKDLEKLQKALKKVSSNIDKNNDLINKHNKKIKKANKDIDSNLKKQDEINEEISVQRTIIEKFIVDGKIPNEESSEYESFNSENDLLQKLQKKSEKLVNDYEGLLRDIEKSTKKINKAENELKSDSKEIEKLKKKIAKQGKLVESIYKQLQSM